jgi:hypothetical protein
MEYVVDADESTHSSEMNLLLPVLLAARISTIFA